MTAAQLVGLLVDGLFAPKHQVLGCVFHQGKKIMLKSLAAKILFSKSFKPNVSPTLEMADSAPTATLLNGLQSMRGQHGFGLLLLLFCF
jgi:hypothetical protein